MNQLLKDKDNDLSQMPNKRKVVRKDGNKSGNEIRMSQQIKCPSDTTIYALALKLTPTLRGGANNENICSHTGMNKIPGQIRTSK